ncbi:hypothetical protein UlMin_009263 [Ulmus minor]
MNTNGRYEDGNNNTNLIEGIASILSRWNGLQMAIKNQWGGCDSIHKSHQLAAHIFSSFSQSRAPLYVEDVENLLHESMLLSFNTDIEDGSIEEFRDFHTNMLIKGIFVIMVN